jgi:hypothetical protein
MGETKIKLAFGEASLLFAFMNHHNKLGKAL